MFRVVGLLALVSVLLTALALISCLSIEDKRLIRGMPRAAWVAVIVLVPLGGAIGWFLAGRPRPAGGTRAGRLAPGGILPEPPRPRAPDDDPEFLRSLGRSTVSSEDEKLLRQWEEDRRKREDKQGHDEQLPDGKRRDQERRDQERRDQERRDQERRDQERQDRERQDRERQDRERRDEQLRDEEHRDLGTDS